MLKRPTNSRVRLNLALQLSANGDMAGADEQIREGLKAPIQLPSLRTEQIKILREFGRSAEAVDAATEEVKTGGGLAFALSQSKRFPKLALQMIAVGEESGTLDDMLLKTADTFDTEAKNTVDRLLAALVPAVTVVMTGVVAVIMMAILLPILNITSSLQ